VTFATPVLTGEGCSDSSAHLGSGCGYPAPGYPASFEFNHLFTIGGRHVDMPIVLALIAAAGVIVFFWTAFAKPKLVPRGVQNIAELGVEFVRDQILRPMMGKEGDKYLPFLVSLFFFIWFMNLMEIIPAAQFPPTSQIAFPVALMLVVYALYNYLGIRKQGLVGYFRNMIPRDVPLFVLPLLAPVEIAQYILVRPFTLAVRLFANMFAGHILLLVFTLATWYLLSVGAGLLFSATSFILTLVLTAFEMLIQALQAYIFTILTAQYIGGALEPEH
jgi:F-type H+-transporting ATPase subunit a